MLTRSPARLLLGSSLGALLLVPACIAPQQPPTVIVVQIPTPAPAGEAPAPRVEVVATPRAQAVRLERPPAPVARGVPAVPPSNLADPRPRGGRADPDSVYGGRFGERGEALRAGPVEKAREEGLAWLVRHQSPGGGWYGDGFMEQCDRSAGPPCDGAGQERQDVGLTGLALLALLGDGNTSEEGPYREAVARGIRWLRDQQDLDTGLIGEKLGHSFLYNHGIAALALCEEYSLARSPLVGRSAQKAVDLVLKARNPYRAWRYDMPPAGDNDTSVTGWMVSVLRTAELAGLEIDRSALLGAGQWIDEVTDTASGRVGYDSVGSRSSRVQRVNDHFPPERGEAMTAVGLFSRVLLGQHTDEPQLVAHAELLRRQPPEWDPEHLGVDMYYWFQGTHAMFQMGGEDYWKPWNEAMKTAVVSSQRTGGDARGSWDPVGPWGYAGGRVYSTALMTLCLEVYQRYARLDDVR